MENEIDSPSKEWMLRRAYVSLKAISDWIDEMGGFAEIEHVPCPVFVDAKVMAAILASAGYDK